MSSALNDVCANDFSRKIAQRPFITVSCLHSLTNLSMLVTIAILTIWSV